MAGRKEPFFGPRGEGIRDEHSILRNRDGQRTR